MVLSSATGSQRINAIRTSLGGNQWSCLPLPVVDLSHLVSRLPRDADADGEDGPALGHGDGDLVAVGDAGVPSDPEGPVIVVGHQPHELGRLGRRRRSLAAVGYATVQVGGVDRGLAGGGSPTKCGGGGAAGPGGDPWGGETGWEGRRAGCGCPAG